MWRFIRNTSLVLIIAGLVAYIVINEKYLILTDRSNPAAEGFSAFYGNVRGSFTGPRRKTENVLTLPDTSAQLTAQLTERRKHVSPASVHWRGSVTPRRFQEGDTLKTRLSQYTQDEGIALYWTLPRDYVVKQYFQTDMTLIGTVYLIAQSVAPDFSTPVLSYYCPSELAAVITDKPNRYLEQYCITANTPAISD